MWSWIPGCITHTDPSVNVYEWREERSRGRQGSNRGRFTGMKLSKGLDFTYRWKGSHLGLGLVQKTVLVPPPPSVVVEEWESMLPTLICGLVLVKKKRHEWCRHWKYRALIVHSGKGVSMERTGTTWNKRMSWGNNFHAIIINSLIQEIFIRGLLCGRHCSRNQWYSHKKHRECLWLQGL